jgi:hypothetical protein
MKKGDSREGQIKHHLISFISVFIRLVLFWSIGSRGRAKGWN